MMNFSLWMAMAFAQSQKMTQWMMWPAWPYAAGSPQKPRAAPVQEE